MYFTRIAILISLLSSAQILTVGNGGHPQVSKLSSAQKAVLVPALRDATGDHATNILRSFTVYEAPLSDTEPPAIIAISVDVGCGVSPNCEFLVFRQQGKKDVPILNDVAGDWDLKNTRHHGYRDLVLTNYQGVHTVVSIWQYDGHRYCMSSQMDRATDGSQAQLPVNRCGS
ncbi:MAG TPA: hypothetical protein VMU48_04015 [Terracidiphilus sp.]|nr:hypothetical protein [Terracidiphilus sp.]